MRFDSDTKRVNYDGWASFHEVMPHPKNNFKEEWNNAAHGVGKRALDWQSGDQSQRLFLTLKCALGK